MTLKQVRARFLTEKTQIDHTAAYFGTTCAPELVLLTRTVCCRRRDGLLAYDTVASCKTMLNHFVPQPHETLYLFLCTFGLTHSLTHIASFASALLHLFRSNGTAPARHASPFARFLSPTALRVERVSAFTAAQLFRSLAHSYAPRSSSRMPISFGTVVHSLVRCALSSCRCFLAFFLMF